MQHILVAVARWTLQLACRYRLWRLLCCMRCPLLVQGLDNHCEVLSNWL